MTEKLTKENFVKSTDRGKLSSILNKVYELHGKQVSTDTVMLWYGILEKYEIADIQKAFSEVMSISQFLPKPADIINVLDPCQWPTPAEAWASYPQDERSTGVMCEETGQAWAIAEELWYAGDMIGARRAFEGAYERIVEEAKRQGKRKPKFWLSLGWDEAGRKTGAHDAYKKGYLAYEAVKGYIGHDTEAQRLIAIERSDNGRTDLHQIAKRLLDGSDGHGAEGEIPEGA